MKKTQVIIIDDDEFLLRILNIRFATKEIELVCFESAEEALSELPKHDPHFIILDIYLPGMNGVEAGKKIRSMPGFEKTPFIFLSASDREEDKIEARKMGAISYLIKPFNPDVLENIILGKSGLERAEINSISGQAPIN